MKPLFEEANPRWRDTFFYEYWKDLGHAIPTMTAVRTDRYKSIMYPEIHDIDEMYDLEKDPHEVNNLVVDPACADLYASMQQRMAQQRAANQWPARVYPKNFPRVRGKEGVLLDLAVENGKFVGKANSGLAVTQHELTIFEDPLYFDGERSAFEVPFSPVTDPAGRPFRIDLAVKRETDGVIAVQSTSGDGFKIFVQDGRPGVSILSKTWIAASTTSPDASSKRVMFIRTFCLAKKKQSKE